MNFTSEAYFRYIPWEEQPHNYQSYRLKEMFQSGISPRAAGWASESLEANADICDKNAFPT